MGRKDAVIGDFCRTCRVIGKSTPTRKSRVDTTVESTLELPYCPGKKSICDSKYGIVDISNVPGVKFRLCIRLIGTVYELRIVRLPGSTAILIFLLFRVWKVREVRILGVRN